VPWFEKETTEQKLWKRLGRKSWLEIFAKVFRIVLFVKQSHFIGAINTENEDDANTDNPAFSERAAKVGYFPARSFYVRLRRRIFSMCVGHRSPQIADCMTLLIGQAA
jgi:hypothetical protein